jgi:hypothetical protein
MSSDHLFKVGEQTFRFKYSTEDAALFLALGAAVAEVQSLEFHFVNLLGLAAATAGRDHSEVTEEYFAKTMGSVARKLKGENGRREIADHLDEVVSKRNYLIHAFLRTHQWPMSSASEYANAILELDALTKFFRESGDIITLAVRAVKDLPIFLIRTNPDTGLPELV